MINIVYHRSSSINNFAYCQQQWFINYILGWQAPSGTKADLGSATHAVFEVLAIGKKYIQDHNPRANSKFTVIQEPVGEFTFSKKELYTEKFIDQTTERCLNFYIENNPHNTFNYTKDYKFCRKMIHDTLLFDGGELDPRNCNVVSPELAFDIPLKFDWAKYTYIDDTGKEVSDFLRIKGTMDLIIDISDDIMGKCIKICDYKGLPIDTSIPTLDGWKTMGEIKEGDILFDKDGKQTKVIGKSSIKDKQCYKIKFDDTSEVICDDEHLWYLIDGSIVPISDLKINDKIPTAKSIEYEEQSLPIDPYLFGMWLGDGRNRSGEITSGDEFIFSEIERRGYRLGINQEKRNRCMTRTVLGLTTLLKPLNVLHNKHIPDIYLRSSYSQRLDLLRGLMDSDGNANPARQQACFVSCRKQLSDDVKELLTSLGQRVNQAFVQTSTNFKKDVKVYPLAFRPIDINPFLLPRKADRVDPNWGKGRCWYRYVKSIELLGGTMKTQCISVDSPTNTYLCTKNMIPTHNTGQRIDWATGEKKDYAKLEKDIQLLLYNYAIWTLFPDYNIVTTIIFCRDGGPFTLVFDDADRKYFLDKLRGLHEEMTGCKNPKPVSKNRSDFRCTKLCHYYKNDWPGTKKTMCHFIEDETKRIGVEKVIEKYTKEGFNVGHYTDPGSVNR